MKYINKLEIGRVNPSLHQAKYVNFFILRLMHTTLHFQFIPNILFSLLKISIGNKVLVISYKKGSKHKLIPSVISDMKMVKSKDLTNDAVTHSGPTYIAIWSAKHSCSYALHHPATWTEQGLNLNSNKASKIDSIKRRKSWSLPLTEVHMSFPKGSCNKWTWKECFQLCWEANVQPQQRIGWCYPPTWPFWYKSK